MICRAMKISAWALLAGSACVDSARESEPVPQTDDYVFLRHDESYLPICDSVSATELCGGWRMDSNETTPYGRNRVNAAFWAPHFVSTLVWLGVAPDFRCAADASEAASLAVELWPSGDAAPDLALVRADVDQGEWYTFHDAKHDVYGRLAACKVVAAWSSPMVLWSEERQVQVPLVQFTATAMSDPDFLSTTFFPYVVEVEAHRVTAGWPETGPHAALFGWGTEETGDDPRLKTCRFDAGSTGITPSILTATYRPTGDGTVWVDLERAPLVCP
jgi:hypothetical protein